MACPRPVRSGAVSPRPPPGPGGDKQRKGRMGPSACRREEFPPASILLCIRHGRSCSFSSLAKRKGFLF